MVLKNMAEDLEGQYRDFWKKDAEEGFYINTIPKDDGVCVYIMKRDNEWVKENSKGEVLSLSREEFLFYCRMVNPEDSAKKIEENGKIEEAAWIRSKLR